jgi:HSP90 family molecular chaperone
MIVENLKLMIGILMFQVRIMRKRLVRKTFDMIQDIAEKDDKAVKTLASSFSPLLLFC